MQGDERMTNREHLASILNHQSSRSGFWHGCPNPASTEKLFRRFGVKNDFELGLKLGSTCRWIQPEAFELYYPDF